MRCLGEEAPLAGTLRAAGLNIVHRGTPRFINDLIDKVDKSADVLSGSKPSELPGGAEPAVHIHPTGWQSRSPYPEYPDL